MKSKEGIQHIPLETLNVYGEHLAIYEPAEEFELPKGYDLNLFVSDEDHRDFVLTTLTSMEQELDFPYVGDDFDDNNKRDAWIIGVVKENEDFMRVIDNNALRPAFIVSMTGYIRVLDTRLIDSLSREWRDIWDEKKQAVHGRRRGMKEYMKLGRQEQIEFVKDFKNDVVDMLWMLAQEEIM